jgi:hypothetical protein
MTLLRNPGLRPYLDPGVQRSYSYDFVESYSDNWWCEDWSTHYYGDSRDTHALLGAQPAAFLTPAQLGEGRRELKQLMDQKNAKTYLGSLVLAYANAHPKDPDVPESLYLTLRMIRYGCYRADDTPASKDQPNATTIQKAAARLLRQRYAASPWTKKSAPYVG